MNKVWMCLLAAMLFSGAGYAQMGGEEEDLDAEIQAEVDEAFEAMDSNTDGKVTKEELKTAAAAETDEPEGSLGYIDTYGTLLIDFLAADADDNLEVTKAELTALLKTQYAGEKPSLSAADVKALDTEYYTPASKALVDLVDTDGDGAISKAESEAMGGEGFSEVDLNGDGTVTVLEMRKSVHMDTAEYYESEEYEFTEASDTAEEGEIPEAVKERFAAIDADSNGSISKAEIKEALGSENQAEWWGLYIAFLSMDADDSGEVDLEEFAAYGKDDEAGVAHKLYKSDKDAALKEIWGALDTDEDGKVSKAEFGKAFPESNEYEQWDKDSNGDVTKDEFWDGLWPHLSDGFTFEKEDKRTKPEEGGESAPEEGSGEAGGDSDAWNLYKKVGRTWTLKSVTKFGNMEMVSYTKWEVLEVNESSAKVKMTTMDGNKKETFSQEQTIEFTTAEGGEGEAAEEAPEPVEESIKVEAGEFECWKVVTEASGIKTTSWTSKKYPGLAVKVISTGEQSDTRSELVEFTE